jgi:hypothetical protein
VTDKRDSEGKPKKAKRLKINKETLRGLDPKDADVKGGATNTGGGQRCTRPGFGPHAFPA